jgi:glycosyltransferase involved in cell wall biosynthesis
MEKIITLWQAHEANLSGANLAMLEYIDQLTDPFQHIVVLPHEGNMQRELSKRGVDHYVVHQYGWNGSKAIGFVQRLKVAFRTMRAVKRIRSIILENKVKLVCTNTQIPFNAALAARQSNIPHIWFIHEFGEEDFGFSIGKRALNSMNDWSRLIVCNSEAVKQKFKQQLPTAKIERIYQPVSWKVTPKIIDYCLPVEKFLMFGQIVPSKGHMEVIEAFGKIHQSHGSLKLDIKGPGNDSYIQKLQSYIDDHHLRDVVSIEKGYFDKEQVLPAYEVLIVASDHEAFGRVIIEAHKAGVKTIVKNTGGAPELVNSSNGFVYDDVDELSMILSGKIPLNNEIIRLAYDEKEEVERLVVMLKEIANIIHPITLIRNDRRN